MNRPQDSQRSHSQTEDDYLARDQTGEPVEVVRKIVEQPNPATDTVDKVLTPTSIKAKEQDTEKIRQRTAEVERKLQE